MLLYYSETELQLADIDVMPDAHQADPTYWKA